MRTNFDGLILSSVNSSDASVLAPNDPLEPPESTKKKVSLSFIMDVGRPTLVAMHNDNVIAIIAYINSEGKFCTIMYAEDALISAGCDTSWASWDMNGAIEIQS